MLAHRETIRLWTPWGAIGGHWLLPAILFLLIVAARFTYVALYGSDLPSWDQWDGEAALLLRPWQEGTWHISQLLVLHNEHRVAYTRLLTLLLFEANGGRWDNLVEADANAILAAASLTFVYICLRKQSAPAADRVGFVALAIIGVLPYAWENMLSGFQSTFYFLVLISTALIALIAFRVPSRATSIMVVVVALSALVAGASGMLGACAAAFVILCRAWHRRHITRDDAVTSVAMACVAGLGVYLVPHIPGIETLQPTGLTGHLDALLTGLSWPFESLQAPIPMGFRALVALALWLPSALTLIRIGRRAPMTSSAWFALGMSALVFVQLAALAHSRGHDTLHLASRYMDIPALGLAINAWLAVDLPLASLASRGIRAVFIVIFAGLAICGFAWRTPWDMRLLDQRAWYSNRQIETVAGYLASGDPAWLDQPPLEIPYPTAGRLKELLDEKVIADMLPPSVHQTERPARLSASAQWLRDRIKRIVPHKDGRTNGVAHTSAKAPPDGLMKSGGACSLDMINGKPAPADEVAVRAGQLRLDGWAIVSPLDGTENEGVTISLADDGGHALYQPAVKTVRLDVNVALHQLRMGDVGFQTYIDTSNLMGTYRVSVIQAHAQEQLICSNPLRVRITH